MKGKDLTILQNAELLFESKFAEIFYYEPSEAIVCVAMADFIPQNEFEPIFNRVKDEIILKNAKRLVFDKRNFKVFDQPSMIWYYVHLKNEIKEKTGMVTHRKLLPEDIIFRKSVEIGRKNIKINHPEFDFDAFDIQYVESLEDAFTK